MVEYNIPIKQLSLLISCGCNLQCEYCEIHQSIKNPNYLKELQENSIQALKDGTFLQNTLTALKKIKESPDTIETIELWGGEPTLTLEHFTTNIQDWINAFPKWRTLFFSTNGMANADKIIDFAKALDENLTRPLKFVLQYSYDGDYGTNAIRKGNNEIIKETVSNIIFALNEYNFKNLKIAIPGHAVLSFDLIKRLTTYEDILHYWQEIDKFNYYFTTINKNPNVEIGFFGIGLQHPYNGSSWDGINLAAFIEKSLKIPDSYYYYPGLVENFIEKLAGYESLARWGCEFNNESYLKIIKDFCTSESARNDQNSGMYCGSNVIDLKLMYDGTLLNCQNLVYSTKIEELKEDSDLIAYEAKKTLIEHNRFVNFNTDDYETIMKAMEPWKIAKRSAFLNNVHTTSCLFIELAKAGQIKTDYLYDKEKLLIHILIFLHCSHCLYNNTIQTGSAYLRSTGLIRIYANGLLDLIEKQLYLTHTQRHPLGGDSQ